MPSTHADEEVPGGDFENEAAPDSDAHGVSLG